MPGGDALIIPFPLDGDAFHELQRRAAVQQHGPAEAVGSGNVHHDMSAAIKAALEIHGILHWVILRKETVIGSLLDVRRAGREGKGQKGRQRQKPSGQK